jgi:hypothetical protein
MGNWIKMDLELKKKVQTRHLAKVLDIDVRFAVGLLHDFWGWAEEESKDGFMEGETPESVDTYMKMPGFSKAMTTAPNPWLLFDDAGAHLPDFGKNLGWLQKQRAANAARQKKLREAKKLEGVPQ